MGIAKIKNKDRAHFYSDGGICKIGSNMIVNNQTGFDLDIKYVFEDTPEADEAFVVTLKQAIGPLTKFRLEC